MMKKMLSLALTLAMVASITACGSKPETTTTAAEATKAGETAKAGDGAAADVQKIIDRGTLKVGCKSDIPKFSLQNTATGEYEGFEDDIAYEIGMDPLEFRRKNFRLHR